MEFTDAHHHLWDLERVHYPWLMARGVVRFFGDPTPIQKNYLPHDLLGESSRWTPSRSVHIQVGAREEDSLRESLWLSECRGAVGARNLPNAIVAFADLAAPNAEEALEAQAAIDGVRGVRQIIGRHEEEDRSTDTGALIDNPAFRHGLGHLMQRDLSFDLQLVPSQYDAMHRLLLTLPDLRVAICHAGSPWQQDEAGFLHWQQAMRRFAELPQVFCKISGLGMFRRGWSAASMQPWFDHLVDCFSPQRLMLGSNFPVDKLYGSYDRIWDAFDAMSANLGENDRRQLFRDTANAFYRI